MLLDTGDFDPTKRLAGTQALATLEGKRGMKIPIKNLFYRDYFTNFYMLKLSYYFDFEN